MEMQVIAATSVEGDTDDDDVSFGDWDDLPPDGDFVNDSPITAAINKVRTLPFELEMLA